MTGYRRGMSRRASFRCFGVAVACLVACHKPSLPITPGPTDWADAAPLTDADLTALNLPTGFIDLLPHQRATPVTLIRTREGHKDARLTGFAFSVRPEAVNITVHALRRQVALLDAKPKLVVLAWAGPPAAPHGGVAVLSVNASEASALRLSGLSRYGLSVDDFAEFLERWKDVTGLTVVGVDEGLVRVEVDRIPDDAADTFLTGLSAFGFVDGPDIAQLRDDLVHGLPALVAF